MKLKPELCGNVCTNSQACNAVVAIFFQRGPSREEAMEMMD